MTMFPNKAEDPSLIPSDLFTCHNQPGPMFHITNHNINVLLSSNKENQGCSRGVGVVNSSSCSSPSYLDPANIQVNNNNPIFYQHQNLHQNLREFDQSYNGGSSEIMVYKPKPLSLSLSSHNNNTHSNEVFSRNTVPLGPFTGYAMILKESRFLKPAQQLLEEVCDVGVRGMYTDKITAAADDDASLMEPQPLESLSGGGIIGVDDPNIGGDGNEGRKKKPRLLTMLDEVYRRYRQYYQHMHAVVTSFEYVAGLSNAAPYASLAINAMSKHFRCLKNAITDQLQFMNKTHFQTSIRNNGRGPYSHQRPGFLEHQQHVWRPQRGLPDRAVSVLRAWLFEHFLHPYPTDTDKKMLAKQTGLSRSQVSNWFINARVRLWKPMVEEIHMLESQQAQRKSQREEHSRNKLNHDHLPSHSSLHTENPSTFTRNEFPNMAVEQLHRANTKNQQVGVVMSMGSGGATNGFSLTLGLHHQNHGVGLPEPFPMSAAQRFGLAIDNEVCVMSDLGSQNGHFGRDVIGGQLLHDFVG